MKRLCICTLFLALVVLLAVTAQNAASLLAQGPQTPPGGRGPTAPPGPPPTFADLDYAPPEPETSKGHKLDLYIPAGATKPLPVVIWTAGSAWMSDGGKNGAAGLAAQLNPAGYAVAGASIRSSSQVKFPGQLHDIKAAIRWLRANATKYNFDPNHIAIIGDSSGGWTTAMAALTGDAPEMEGSVGTTGVSSKVQAAVAFYPPTNFLTMDAWAVQKCAGPRCHDDAASPESRLVGCAIQTCPDKAQAANPLRYVTAADPPMMILHGGSILWCLITRASSFTWRSTKPVSTPSSSAFQRPRTGTGTVSSPMTHCVRAPRCAPLRRLAVLWSIRLSTPPPGRP